MTHLTSIAPTRIPSTSSYFHNFYAWTAQKIHQLIAIFFFMDWQNLDPARLQASHQRHMQGYTPQSLGLSVDAIRIPAAKNPTGNVVVMCFNGPYQKADPDKWWKPFWEAGADIVLWNPTQVDSHRMAADLQTVLQKLQGCTIAVKASCAISDPAIKAVATLQDPKIHLILDRAFGDAKALARATTIWAKLPLVQTILDHHFHCDGMNLIGNVQGKALFLEAEYDQMLGAGAHNQTRALFQGSRFLSYTSYYMQGADHWSTWDNPTYDYVLNFLRNLKVASENPVDTTKYTPPRLGFFATKILPSLIGAWF